MTDDAQKDAFDSVMDKLDRISTRMDAVADQMADLVRDVTELKANHVTPQQVDHKISEAGKKSRERMDDTLKDFKAQIMQSVEMTLDATIRTAASDLADQTRRAADQMADYQETMKQRDTNHEKAAAQRMKALAALEERVERSETNSAIAKTRADQVALHLYGDTVNPGLIQQFKESLEIIGEIRNLKQADDERKKDMHDMIMSVLNYFPQSTRAKRIAAGLSLPVSGASLWFITNFGDIVSWVVENGLKLLGA